MRFHGFKLPLWVIMVYSGNEACGPVVAQTPTFRNEEQQLGQSHDHPRSLGSNQSSAVKGKN